jgi:cell division protein FtsB
MTFLDNLRNIFQIFLALGIVIMLFFLFFSSSGIIKKSNLEKKLYKTEQKLISLQNHKMKIDKESKMLSRENLDLDFLEEQARIQFNLVGKNEFQINLD